MKTYDQLAGAKGRAVFYRAERYRARELFKFAAPDLSPPLRLHCKTLAIAVGTRAGSDSDASSTNHAPSANSPTTPRAASRARLVLPIPPGPVRVTKR